MTNQLQAYDLVKDITTSVQAGMGSLVGIEGLGYTDSEVSIMRANGCPVNQDSSCTLNGNRVGCMLIRECDKYTGNVHFEYAQPEGTSNVNTNILNADGTITYQNAQYTQVPQTDQSLLDKISQYVQTGNAPITHAPTTNLSSPTGNGVANAGSNGNNSSSSGSSTGGSSTGNDESNQNSDNGWLVIGGLSTIMDWVTQNISIGGFNIPLWALGIGGVTGFMLLEGKSRR